MGKVLGLDRGWSERSMVIWRDGRLLGWTWQGAVREAGRVRAEWADGSGHRWLRVEDRLGRPFLLGNTGGGWQAMPWPPPPGPAPKAPGSRTAGGPRPATPAAAGGARGRGVRAGRNRAGAGAQTGH